MNLGRGLNPLIKISALLLMSSLALTACSDSSPTAAAPEKPASRSCGDDAAKMQSVLNVQMAAFKQNNFTKAYEVTSDAFKVANTLDGFTELISTYYPLLLVNEKVSVVKCTVTPDETALETEISDAAGATLSLIYTFRFENDRWAITGARDNPKASTQAL